MRIYWSLVILLVVVSLAYGSRHFFVPHFLSGEEYYPVTTKAERDEGAFYGPRANAAYWDDLVLGDVNLWEHRDAPALLPMLNPLILGGLGRISGSLKAAFIVSDFLFPALIFLIIYFLALEMIGSRFVSAIFSVIFIFAPKLALFPSPSALSFFIKPESLYFTRFEYPKITYFFFVLALWMVLRTLKRGAHGGAVLAGISLGILFYTYIFDWVYALTGLGLMLILFLWRKNFESVGIVFLILAVALAISIPYWINFYLLHSLPHYDDISSRIGVEISHSFRFFSVWKSYLRILLLAFLLWWLGRKKGNAVVIYLSGLLFAYFAAVNLQVVLGFNPQPDHWYRVSFLPLALSALVLAVWSFERYLTNFSWRHGFVVGSATLALMVFMAFYTQYAVSKSSAANYTLDSAYSASYKWLLSNAPAGSVVGSISASSGELLLYTKNKIFVPNGGTSLASDAEIWERFVLMGRMYGLNREQIADLAVANNFYLFHDKYRDHSHDSYFLGQAPDQNVQMQIRRDARGQYDRVAGKWDGRKAPYRLDYLYFGPREMAVGAEDPAGLMPGLKKVYDQDQIIVYEVFNE